ncbi:MULTISPECIES: glycosyltransferase family A protein [unclassified Streptomyces]|uniref:glycosyltransferase family A protein n=1 Tax=unclassified Streptomyces TaxID=2593676 RepID=UPI0013721590|nr:MULTISPECIES: glycosyltransferase family A protein [unclassified Streptomyces]NDZ98738.1 glycosyltransferase [Streptomyces sp. SID10116]MYY83400.1 glycosyltransferase [Streptomyces sp. SID335]MYZ15738.1 glycosyltransferase [Streptomyces sp. SID337]NDZ84762.1 glycosyltransferase [Streptomyces sp. SID10115]NEB43045.1 glycosyltransferase [Streptomyces sp. SID339]
MTRIMSVVTPVHDAALPFLPEAYASLRSQELPNGWAWEWLIQVDGGKAVDVPADIREDARVAVGDNRRGGPGVARTMAWGRSKGELVKVLDADDVLPAGALARDIEVLEAHPSVGWTVCKVLDLMPDGSLVHYTLGDPDPGQLTRGELYAYWSTTHRPAVHPASLCIRESLLAQAGGWMALPASEDTALLLALDVMADGWFIGEAGLHYRKHPGQTTAHPDHRGGAEWEARSRAIGKRIKALAARYLPTT